MKRKIFREQFDSAFDLFFEKNIAEIESNYYDKTLQKTIQYAKQFQQGGKRIRPYLVYAMHEAFGGKQENIIALSMSNELIHLFALVHDDIIDKGTTRHGIPTYHKHIEALYDDKHLGIAQGLLIGDLFYTRARKNLCEHTNNPDVIKFFAELLQEVVIGEMLDVHMSATPIIDDPEKIIWKDMMKSGYYTFTRPMMLGGIIAGVDAQTLKQIEEVGSTIATAFQMRDDLLDCIEIDGNKTVFSDLQEGNQTILLHNTLHRVSEKDRDFILSNRGKSLDQETIATLRTIIYESGAITETAAQINEYLDRATEQLDQLLQQENPMHANLKELIDFLRISL